MKNTTVIVLALIIGASPLAGAYDPVTHQTIGERAAAPAISQLDTVLKTDLSIPAGVDQRFFGPSLRQLRSIAELIGDGSLSEDVPSIRGLNHFHNPLIHPWDGAGLRAFSLFGIATVRGQSSVLWQQNPDQDTTVVFTPLPFQSGGGTWTWATARSRYLEALTNPAKDDQGNQHGRDTAFAELFENLGHLTHVVQDATVPAHTRNDAHPPFIRPDLYETWVQQNINTAQGFINAAPTKPSRSIFADTGNPQAPVPIARLIDTDTFLGANSIVLKPDNQLIGIGEYTNGNFLSRGTRFRDFDLPQSSSLDPGEVVEEKPGKFRRYFKKARDGATIEHFATEGMLFDSQVAAQGAPLPTSGWMLDNRVHRDYAADLIPRAVGYSAGLLDYFFRGKLDAKVDVVDAMRYRLTGRNLSDDALGAGTLLLYAEDKNSTNPTRTLITDIQIEGGGSVSNGEIPIAGVAKNQPLPTLTFTSPISTDTFVAVYTGDLGTERKNDATGFIGGVIGKVISGPRAEAIVPRDEQRLLRTADGVFPLPLATGLQAMQWGDLDNTFVGLVPTEPGGFIPREVQAFRLGRPVGSSTVPLGADGSVTLESLKTAAFPFGLSVGTTVTVTQTTQYQQTLLTFDAVTTLAPDPNDPNTCVFVSSESRMPTREDVASDSASFSHNIPIILDEQHLVGGPGTGQPYQWSVVEVGLDAQQRLLALVEARLTTLDGNGKIVPFRKRDEHGHLQDSPYVLAPELPVPFSLLALIDVERGQVLGVTSAPSVTIAFQTLATPSLLQRHAFVQGCGPGGESWQDASILFTSDPPQHPIVELGAIALPPSGYEGFAFTGQYRSDLESLVGTSLGITTESFNPLVVFALDGDAPNQVYKAYRAPMTNSRLTGYLTSPGGSLRMRPAARSTADVLVMFLRPTGVQPEKAEAVLARWVPEGQSALAFPDELPARAFYALIGATSQAGLITALELPSFESVTLLVDSVTNTARTVARDDLSTQYVLLAPTLLYNVEDTHFHTLDDLGESNLPVALAPADSVSPFDATFHVVETP